MRGVFDFIAKNSEYKKMPKRWQVSLLQSDSFWWDMIVDLPSVIDGDPIKPYLRNLKKEVESTLEKRFIYYFASLPRVRFDLKRPPRKSLFSKTLVITLLIGKKQKRVWFRCDAPIDNDGKVAKDMLIEDKFIRFWYSQDHSETHSVHDFIRMLNIQLGFSSTVHYVGITKNPEDRPLSREHRGISDTLYKFRSENYDFFLFVNLYKVTSRTFDFNAPVSFIVSNAMIDEVNVDVEGAIVEHSLVAYFNSDVQKEKNQAKGRLYEKIYVK